MRKKSFHAFKREKERKIEKEGEGGSKNVREREREEEDNEMERSGERIFLEHVRKREERGRE